MIDYFLNNVINNFMKQINIVLLVSDQTGLRVSVRTATILER